MQMETNRIEITSGGGLPQGLSQEEFLEGVTAPRNKELANDTINDTIKLTKNFKFDNKK